MSVLIWITSGTKSLKTAEKTDVNIDATQSAAKHYSEQVWSFSTPLSFFFEGMKYFSHVIFDKCFQG